MELGKEKITWGILEVLDLLLRVIYSETIKRIGRGWY